MKNNLIVNLNKFDEVKRDGRKDLEINFDIYPKYDNSLKCIILTEEFWGDENLWPEWFKDKTHPLEGDNSWYKVEMHEKGFLCKTSKLAELDEDKKCLYEFEGWKPTLFIGCKGFTQDLGEGDIVAYDSKSDSIVFGDRHMFTQFFV